MSVTLSDDELEALLRKHREFEVLLGRIVVRNRVQSICHECGVIEPHKHIEAKVKR